MFNENEIDTNLKQNEVGLEIWESSGEWSMIAKGSDVKYLIDTITETLEEDSIPELKYRLKYPNGTTLALKPA